MQQCESTEDHASTQISLKYAAINYVKCNLHNIIQLTMYWNRHKQLTSGYATMVHSRGCNPHRCTTTFANVEITSLWRHNSETIRDRQKRRPYRSMKSSELSNGENRIALRQLLQNRKTRHWWRHNLGSRWKLQKMAWENFSIRALYNITKNQHNPIKTVGQDSFLRPKTPKNTSFVGVTQPPGLTQPLYSRGHN